MSIRSYHNPRCLKRREILASIRERGIDPVVIRYRDLEHPPVREEVKRIIHGRNVPTRDWILSGEPADREPGLADGALHDDALIEAVFSHFELGQRPSVFQRSRPRTGRSAERVEEILP